MSWCGIRLRMLGSKIDFRDESEGEKRRVRHKDSLNKIKAKYRAYAFVKMI